MTAAATTATPADRLFRRVLTALALGIAVGLFLGEYVWPLKIVSDVYVKLLQVTVLPYVLGSVIAGLGAHSPEDGKRLAIRGGVMLLLFWVAAFAIVIATSLAYPPGRSSSAFVADLPPATPIDWIDLYIPSNVFHALAFNVLPAVVLFGILAGASLSGMSDEHKRPLLSVVAAFNEVMGRISRSIIVTTPIGLFAMSAAAAGTMRVEEFVRLQVWFVVYIGSACLVSLWLLPALVALLTPVPYGRFLRTLQTAMLTAFAAGDYFVVLPMIAEANKQLLVEQGRSEHDADRTIGVVVPLLFNFPHTGKILSLAFVPFAAWFSNSRPVAGAVVQPGHRRLAQHVRQHQRRDAVPAGPGAAAGRPVRPLHHVGRPQLPLRLAGGDDAHGGAVDAGGRQPVGRAEGERPASRPPRRDGRDHPRAVHRRDAADVRARGAAGGLGAGIAGGVSPAHRDADAGTDRPCDAA